MMKSNGDSTNFSGLPVVVASDLAEEAVAWLPERLRVARWSGNYAPNGKADRFDAADLLPSDIILAIAANPAEREAMERLLRDQDKITPLHELTGPTELAVALLNAALETIAQGAIREAALREALASIREEAEETRVAALEQRRQDMRGMPAQALELAWSSGAPDANALMHFSGCFELQVTTQIESWGVAALGMHIAGGAFSTADQLEIRLVGEESGCILGAWTLPPEAIPARGDWLTLDFPAPVAVARETAMVEIKGELSADGWLALSQAESLSDDRASAGPSPALRLYVAREPRACKPRWWVWRRPNAIIYDEPAANSPFAAPASSWIAARVHGSAVPASSLEGEKRLRLSPGVPSILVFPDVALSGACALGVDLRVLNGDGIVDLAIGLLPTSSPAPDDLASICDAALLWSPLQTLRDQAAIATLALQEGAPTSAHVALAMRLHPAPNDDFVVVGCKGLWLYPEDSIEKTDYRAIFGGSAPSRHRDACFDEVSLDEIYADDHYRHLDLSVTQLAEDGMSWPRVKFKLFENRGECGVEFRTGENWPKFFRVWPGAQVDRFGPVHTIVGAEAFAEAVASAPHEDDRRLLAALMDLLVPIVRTLGGRGDISPSEVAQWIETARKLQAGMV